MEALTKTLKGAGYNAHLQRAETTLRPSVYVVQHGFDVEELYELLGYADENNYMMYITPAGTHFIQAVYVEVQDGEN